MFFIESMKYSLNYSFVSFEIIIIIIMIKGYLIKMMIIKNRIGNEMKKWREAYKAMVLLEFLLTHGPLHLPHDFIYDLDHFRFFSTFQYIDDKG